jgi:hypothetical protein
VAYQAVLIPTPRKEKKEKENKEDSPSSFPPAEDDARCVCVSGPAGACVCVCIKFLRCGAQP